MSTSGLRIRSGPSAPVAKHYRYVREAFERAWRDFYDWSPYSTRPLAEARLATWAASDDPALHLYKSLMDDVDDEPPEETGDDLIALEEVPNAPAQLGISQVYPKKRPGSTKPPSYALNRTLLPLPAYTFAMFVAHNLDIPEEYRCRFIPSWDYVDFDDDGYLAMFGGQMEAMNQGRDPACDIIAVETRSRLRGSGLGDAEIDATRVLPLTCGRIDALSVERDLPPFPSEPLKVLGSIVGDAADTVWEPQAYVPPEADQVNTDRDCVEEFCTFPGCFQYGCSNYPSHVTGQMLLQADPLIRPITLRRPDVPCSRHCCALEALEGALPWPEEERRKLQRILSETEGSPCQTRMLLAHRTCAEIAAQVECLRLLTAVPRRPARRGCACLARSDLPRCLPEKCPCARAREECIPGVCINSPKGHSHCGNMPTLGIPVNPPLCLRVGISKIAGYGLYMDQDCPKGTVIGEYTGESITGPESEKREIIYQAIGRNYMFDITDESTGDTVALIDGDRCGSLLRYLNSGEKPNCIAINSHASSDPRMTFVTSRAISKGEELLLNYGTKFFAEPAQPVIRKRKRGT